MDKMYVTFRVEVSDVEYSYRNQGAAELKIQVPRTMLDDIDPGILFIGILKAAIVDFDTPKDEDE